MSNFRRFLLIAVLVYSGSAFSQVSVSGRITDTTGRPVPSATVIFKKDTLGIASAFSISDANGNFSLLVTRGKPGWITVSAVNYLTTVYPFQSVQDTVGFHIRLFYSTKQLQEVIVRSIPSVVVSGDTTSFTADNFKRGNEVTIVDLLNNIPGFKALPNGLITYNGRVIDRVLINGDDMTGQNYTGLTKYLDTEGIGRLQVIDNYSNPDNVLSRFTSGQQQVLNIDYKAGFLNKYFGSIEAGLSPDLNFYKGKAQIKYLQKKSKFIGIGSVNNSGSRNADITSFLLSGNRDNDFDIDNSLSQVKSIAQIAELSSSADGLESFNGNNTAYSTLNFIVRPSRKVSLKGRLTAISDKFEQYKNTQMDYNTLPGFSILQQNQFNKKSRDLEGALLVNYFPDNKNQLLFSLTSMLNDNYSGAGTLLNTNSVYTERQEDKFKALGLKFMYNHLRSENAVFTIAADYSDGLKPQGYSVTPVSYADFWGAGSAYNQFTQNAEHRIRDFELRIQQVVKKKRHTIILNSSVRRMMEYLDNNVYFSGNGRFVVNKDSLNNSRAGYTKLGVRLQDRIIFSRKISLNLGINPQVVDLFVDNKYDFNSGKVSRRWLVLPDLGFSWQLSKSGRVNVSVSATPQFYDRRFIGNGFIVQDIASVYKGIDTAAVNSGENLGISYSYINLLKSRIVFVSSLSFSNSPQFYLQDFRSFNNYTFSEIIPTNRKNSFYSLSLSFLRFSRNYKTQFLSQINLLNGSSYNFIQGSIMKVNYRFSQFLLGVNSIVKRIQLKSSLQYSNQVQFFTERFSVNQFYFNLGLNIKMTEQLFFEISNKYLSFFSTSRLKSDLYLTGFDILWKSSNKNVQFNLSGGNIFNFREFSDILITSQNRTTTSYKIFPRVIMAKCTFRF